MRISSPFSLAHICDSEDILSSHTFDEQVIAQIKVKQKDISHTFNNDEKIKLLSVYIKFVSISLLYSDFDSFLFSSFYYFSSFWFFPCIRQSVSIVSSLHDFAAILNKEIDTEYSYSERHIEQTGRKRNGIIVLRTRRDLFSRVRRTDCSHVSPTTSEIHCGKINRHIPRVFSIPRIRQEFREYSHTMLEEN